MGWRNLRLAFADIGLMCAGNWGISVFIVLFIRSATVLICALVNLAKDRTNPWGNRLSCCRSVASTALFVLCLSSSPDCSGSSKPFASEPEIASGALVLHECFQQYVY